MLIGLDDLPMQLDDIIPWGRTLTEYQLMFSLTDADLAKTILGCGDGPASFNAEMTALGHSVVSVDPIYAYSAASIQQRVQATYDTVITQVRQNADRYVWQTFPNPDVLGAARLAAMEQFLADYEPGLAAGRYLATSLPALEFADGLRPAKGHRQFELCVCSHLLFLYSAQLSLQFHLDSIRELLRVATEVRIFPLLQLDCQPSAYLEPVMQMLDQSGYEATIQPVAYEFQKGGNQMLRIRNRSKTNP
jgi:hypothetical protein